ncbi:hypothetical protein G7B40_024585 [Aetokthonos hydrillicola Thurmond2011]|jgi:hypothetical protein|uniref:Uncharacterized protein n=1 Tax=Aetokthonos hydrillicola Thurmond2011 TaxID=2712845 RepID=A0AAP5IEX6_9CYAN|nr:hypothetical protein [Aetokthonos hydrillicola]MBO3461585.1 hypothetical protein [Aetokthonos hydrillicola CCALA 1050]MBW4586113.1 hypothetical protein [Aetokthonos hydrillicola CCALA 1050]MDR9897720.1 hypothetical protein [Aetokthonos hydrillicola Thurmond2011]
MQKHNQFRNKNTALLGTIFGSLLIGVPIIPQVTLAQQPILKVNPCPSIFYEEPHNHQVLVPNGCPPNAATLRMRVPLRQPFSVVVPTGRRSSVIQPPLPENRQNAVASVTPMAGEVNVRLKNDTNARVSYQAIGYTAPRILTGGQTIVLRNLPTPVTITMVRKDGGFIKVTPMYANNPGTLAVSLNEKTAPDNNQGVLRIQRDGQVFLN